VANKKNMQEKIKLTQYSKGAGCGCKIAPKVLQEILQTNQPQKTFANLLVGNSTNDDAAVMDMGNGMSLISTTDFFTPIVDDAFQFGCIAAANAISDIYAMGGKPALAVAILGFPVEKLPVTIAQQILEGARKICNEANIPLAGGHSIDSPEPIFGLAVNGFVKTNAIKKNSTAQIGNLIYLTKKIGVGILATAEKRNVLLPEHENVAANQMMQLNKIGEILGDLDFVKALTDVTGFGLGGHLIELCDGANLSAELYWNKIPLIDNLKNYLDTNCIPDATYRNWNGYGDKIKFEPTVPMMDAFKLLPCPETSGGLLIAIDENYQTEFEKLLNESGLNNFSQPIGKLILKEEKVVVVI
jgi:selenide,water dikinase